MGFVEQRCAMDALIVCSAYLHVFLSPYTKVEESFNLHATHDALFYGISPSSLQNYDHFIFPGAVPRSFLGSIALAKLSLPIIYTLESFDLVLSKADIQLCARLALATVNALSLCFLRRAVGKRFGFPTAAFFSLLTTTQFHLPFWMGRTLPNMFALPFVNVAYALLLSRQPNSTRPTPFKVKLALALLTFAAVVFRVELVILLATLVIQTLFSRWLSFWSLFKTGILSGLLSVAITTIVDTIFWRSQTPLWPELHSLLFNVYHGNASQWGTLPAHTYFTSFLPKLLLTAFPLSILGFLVDSRIRGLLISAIVFITGMSALGHKEWRFIVYCVPVANIAAGRGCSWLIRQRIRPLVGKLLFLSVLGCIVINVLITAILTQVSMHNYPGGVALSRFNQLYNGQENLHVHISNLAAQTGASLFLQVHAPPYPSSISSSSKQSGSSNNKHSHAWIYDKRENLSPADIISPDSGFTHAIVEVENSQISAFLSNPGWRKVECIDAFDRFLLHKGGKAPSGGLWERIPRLEFVYTEKLCIFERI